MHISMHCVIAVSYRLTICGIVSKQISHSTKELTEYPPSVLSIST